MNLLSRLERLVVVQIPLDGHQQVLAGCVKVGIFIPPKANQWIVVLVLSRVVLVLNSFRVGKMLVNHIEVVINLNIFFIQFVQICLHVFFAIYEILYIVGEAENAPNVGKKRCKAECFI